MGLNLLAATLIVTATTAGNPCLRVENVLAKCDRAASRQRADKLYYKDLLAAKTDTASAALARVEELEARPTPPPAWLVFLLGAATTAAAAGVLWGVTR